MQKQFLSISLIVAFLLPLGGQYAFLQYQRYSAKKQVKHAFLQQLPAAALTYFSFQESKIATAVRWEHAQEFEYQAQMYDVVRADTVAGYIHLWCWHDAKESAAQQELRVWVARNMGHETPLQEQNLRFFNFLKTLFFHPNAHIPSGMQETVTRTLQAISTWVEMWYAASAPPPHTPPPQTLFT